MIESNHKGSIQTAPLAPALVKMGWSEVFQLHLERIKNVLGSPARVVGVSKNSFVVSQGTEAWRVTAAGRLGRQPRGLYPVVGDWVMATDTVIHTVLPRKNALVRGAAGRRGKQDGHAHKEQVMAANLDTVFVVCGLDRDFNPRRIERYVTLVYNCDLSPVVILTKADLHPHPEPFAAEIERVACGVPVHLVSATEGSGLMPLATHLAPGRTVTMVGSSGAGKSTLLNRLYGAPVQATGLISHRIGKGRHTTTSRDLIRMPQGGMVIDNPGIREIALWDGKGGLEQAFADIEGFAGACRFSNCSHLHEPGCRVRKAVADGEITPDRLESYQKLQREAMYAYQREQKSADRLEKERWKEITLKAKAIKKKRHKAWRP